MVFLGTYIQYLIGLFSGPTATLWYLVFKYLSAWSIEGMFSIWRTLPWAPEPAVRPAKLIRGLLRVTQVNMLMVMNIMIV